MSAIVREAVRRFLEDALYTLDERFIRTTASHGYPVRHPAASQ